MSHDEGLLEIMLSKMANHKTDYYDAAEEQVTYYYVEGEQNRLKDQGKKPREFG